MPSRSSAAGLVSTRMRNCSAPLHATPRILIPLPFAAWRALAWTAELLPNPPVTRNQVELMQVDNVCSPGVPGFAELGIAPHSVEEILQETLRSRQGGG